MHHSFVFFCAAALLAGGVALHAQSTTPATPTAPNGMVDRALTTLAMRQLAERNARVAALRTPADVETRQAYIRARLLEQIGGLPEKTPLNPRVTGTLDRDGYTVEKLIYESRPHYYVTANVYVPKAGRQPFPAVLGTAGHNADGKSAELYQRLHEIAVPGVLRDFDLPDLAQALGPRLRR